MINDEQRLTADFLARALGAMAPPRTPLRLIDFGCGEGQLVAELAARGFDAAGCDIVQG